MMPKTNWLDDYIAYAQQLTDAPTVFHRFVGLSVLGAAMGNRWKMANHRGGFDHTNLWCLIIAKSSQLHKSTAAQIGVRLAHEADVPYLPSYGSTEAIAQLLMKEPYGLMYADEFDQFLRGLGRDYTAGRGFFASLYDGVVAPQAFNKGTVKGSFDIAATFLACTTMSWLTDQMKESDIEGGLLPRFLLIPAWKSDRPLMELPPTDFDHAWQQRLVIGLRWVMGQQHTCYRTPGAEMIYRAWMKRTLAMPLDGTRGEAWPYRVTTICHKLSMIYHAARKGLDGKISEQDMQSACDTSTEALHGMKQILLRELALTKVEKELQTLRRVLEMERFQEDDGWVPYSMALRHCHMDARQFKSLLTTAMQSEFIEFGKSKRGNPPIRLVEHEPGEDG